MAEKRHNETVSVPANGNAVSIKTNYKLVLDSYYGNGGFDDGGYLFPHFREPAEDFTARQKQAYYINLIKPIVDSVTDPIFTQDVARIYKSSLYDEFVKDCNNNSLSLTQYMSKAVKMATLLGQSFTVMDTFKPEDIPDTLQAQIDDRKVPFISLKLPTDVIEFTTNDFGGLTSISFYHRSDPECGLVYRYYDNSVCREYCIKNSKQETLNEYNHNLGTIPVLLTDPSAGVFPIPPYLSMSQLARATYNQLSELRDLGRSSSFSLLVIPGQNPKTMTEVGAKNVLFIHQDSTTLPTYISPDSKINDTSLMEIKFSIEAMIAQGNSSGSVIQSGSLSVKSGVALAFEFKGQGDALNKGADMAEALEVSIANLFGLFATPFEFAVHYEREYMPFTSDEINKKLTFLETILAMNISDEVNAAVSLEILDLFRYNSNISKDRFIELKESVMK